MTPIGFIGSDAKWRPRPFSCGASLDVMDESGAEVILDEMLTPDGAVELVAFRREIDGSPHAASDRPPHGRFQGARRLFTWPINRLVPRRIHQLPTPSRRSSAGRGRDERHMV